MAFPTTQDELVSRIQHYLDAKVKGKKEIPDYCILAILIDQVSGSSRVPRVLAIVRNAYTKQAAVFLLDHSNDFNANGALIKTTELLKLDDAFRCEPGHSVILKISGHSVTRLRPRRSQRSIYKSVPPTGDGSSPHLDSSAPGSLLDSDEPSEPLRVISLGETDESGESPGFGGNLPVGCITVQFPNLDDATRFRETAVLHSCQAQSFSNDTSNRTGDLITFEMGKDALHSLNPTDDFAWLQKYRREVIRCKHGHIRVISSSTSAGSVGSTSSIPGTNRVVGLSPSQSGTSDVDSSSSEPDSVCSSPSSVSLPSANSGQLTNLVSRSPTNVSGPPYSPASLPPRTFPLSVDSPSVIRRQRESQSSNSNQLSMTPDFPGEVRTNSVAPVDPTQGVSTGESLASSQSCSDLLQDGTGIPFHHGRRQSKGFFEDHLFRARLLQADLPIRQKLLDRVDEFSTIEKIHIFVGTWNVNGRHDLAVNVDEWIAPEKDDLPPADIYAFGFQELDLSIGSVALNKTAPAALEDRWTAQLESAMGGLLQPAGRRFSPFGEHKGAYAQRWSKHTGGGYRRLRRVRLAGILLIVYISERLFRYAVPSEMTVQMVPTGVFNMMGNKGAVGLRLTLFNTALCFVNCHLAAGEANLERRNQDFQEIKRKMLFERRAKLSNSTLVDVLNMQDHDIVFVFGDLNYRISGLDLATVRYLVSKQEYDQLLAYDELRKQCASHRAFGMFRESRITFAPTYKFDMNSNTYDTSDKARIPSYCDRILWYGKLCEALVYRSHGQFTMSDHKPVSAFFSVGLRRINRSAYQRTYEAVVRSQDLVYNLSLPQAHLSEQELDFGPVRFYEVCQRQLTLTNTGLTGMQYEFLREGIVDFPPWLTVTPETMNVEKGASVQINLEVFVKPELVVSFNNGSSTLSTITVLRLLGGKDYFISIGAQFVPTCFGLPLTLLLTLDSVPVGWMPVDELHEKIRSARVGDWRETEPSVLKQSETAPFNVPKEVFRLTDFITQRLDEPDLFRQSGQYSDVCIIRDMLDTTLPNVAFPETVSVHAAAFSLLVFLNTLTEPVIPAQFQSNCLDGCSSFALALKALARIPVDHQNLFCYIVAFLRRCLAHSQRNGTDIQLLSGCFGDVIFQNTSTNAQPTQNRKTSARSNPVGYKTENTALFIRHFLSNDPSMYFNNLQH